MSIDGQIDHPPQLRQTTKGHPVCNFILRTSRQFRKAGEKDHRTYTDRIPITAWDHFATETAKLPAGTKVHIEGRIQMRERRFVGFSQSDPSVIVEEYYVHEDMLPATKPS